MKARIRKTGEIVDVISFSGKTTRENATDTVSYIDSKGNEHENEPMNFYWDMESVTDDGIEVDWEKVRIKAAIEAMGAYCKMYNISKEGVAVRAVEQADILVEKLKSAKA